MRAEIIHIEKLKSDEQDPSRLGPPRPYTLMKILAGVSAVKDTVDKTSHGRAWPREELSLEWNWNGSSRMGKTCSERGWNSFQPHDLRSRKC